MATLKLPKPKVLKDPSVPGNTTLRGGINAGFLQDPGVPGMTLGAGYGSIPSLAGLPPLTVAPGSDYVGPPGTTVPGTTTSGGGGGGGSALNPNRYLSEILGDPVYQNALTRFNSALGGARTSLDEQIRQAVISSGYDPTGGMTGSLAQYASALTPDVLQAAAGNTTSTKAQIQSGLDRGLAGLNAQLAARGGLQSGAQDVGASRLNEQAQLQGSQAMSQLLDALTGGAQNYAQFSDTQQGNLNSAYDSVANRLAALQGYSGPGDTSTSSDGTNTSGGGANTSAGGATTPLPSASTGPVSWMGKMFTTKAGLAAYLQKTPGGYRNYAAWAVDHPGAAARLA